MMKMFKVGTVLLAAWGAVLMIWSAPVTAALANVSHSYRAASDISSGALVSLSGSKSGYVEPANTSNGSKLTGVAVNSKQSLLAVNPNSSFVQVATTGNVNVLVSTVNGSISVGDQISVSPFNGIGMKANPGLNVVGLAQTAFNQNSLGATREKVKDKQGKSNNIWVGYISLNINITTDNNTSSLGNGLQQLVNNITGRVVPTYRIIISLVIAAITLLALVIVTYSAIYGSIISVGRNPLAKHEVYRTLRSVAFMAILITAAACLTVYILLV